MKRIKVESSQIISVGYDYQACILEIEFKTGVYQYRNVPWDKVLKLLFTESVGGFFMKNIKNVYEYEKVG